MRAGVAAGTVTYYVNITHLLRYIALYATVHKFPDTPENEIKHFGNITTIIWSSSSSQFGLLIVLKRRLNYFAKIKKIYARVK